MLIPKIGKDEPILTSIFFKWVGSTTNHPNLPNISTASLSAEVATLASRRWGFPVGKWRMKFWIFFPPKNTSEDQPCLPKKGPSLNFKRKESSSNHHFSVFFWFRGSTTTTVEIVSENSRVYQEVAKSHYLCSFYLLMCFVSLRRALFTRM